MKKINYVLLFAFISAAAALAPYIYRFYGSPIVADTTKWSEFGTYVGGMLGPLFTLITVYLLIETLDTQKKQVESANQSAEEAKQLQSQQQSLMSKQSFEQTFFSWMHSYRDLANSVVHTRYRRGGASAEHSYGRHALLRIWEDWMSPGVLSQSGGQNLPPDVFFNIESGATLDEYVEKMCAQHAINQSQKMLIDHNTNVDNLFNTLRQLMYWVDITPHLDWRQRHDYIAMLRAQVSTIELKLIFFYSLSLRGESLCALINKYGFFTDANFSERLMSLVRAHIGNNALKESAFDEGFARAAEALQHT